LPLVHTSTISGAKWALEAIIDRVLEVHAKREKSSNVREIYWRVISGAGGKQPTGAVIHPSD